MPQTRARNVKARVSIQGLDGFIQSLNLAAGQIKRTTTLFAAEAIKQVAAIARGLAVAQGGVAAKASKDLIVRQATLTYGGNGYNLGAEFGAYRYKQFQTWRGNGGDAGYFLFPAIRQLEGDMLGLLWFREVWAKVEPLITGE